MLASRPSAASPMLGQIATQAAARPSRKAAKRSLPSRPIAAAGVKTIRVELRRLQTHHCGV